MPILKKKKKDKIKNQDIIDFRYWIINKMYPKDGNPTSLNAYDMKIYEDILCELNNHFSFRGYDIG